MKHSVLGGFQGEPLDRCLSDPLNKLWIRVILLAEGIAMVGLLFKDGISRVPISCGPGLV